MSSEARQQLVHLNDCLKAQYRSLKAAKHELGGKIATLLRREQQLSQTKAQIQTDLTKAQKQAKADRGRKAHQYACLRDDLRSMDKTLLAESLQLKTLQDEYQICLQGYDTVRDKITLLLSGTSSIQAQLSRLGQSNAAIRTMIFDCQRLKRVLIEERRYFKQLSNNQEKSHSQRFAELAAIRLKLVSEDKESSAESRAVKYKIALWRLHSFFLCKVRDYSECLLRIQLKSCKQVALGIKQFQNCLALCSVKKDQVLRRYFSWWNKNAFAKEMLSTVVQLALASSFESKAKLRVLNCIANRANSSRSEIIRAYAKMKFLATSANTVARKDLHYGFDLWRAHCHKLTQCRTILQKLLLHTIPRRMLSASFCFWKYTAKIRGRIVTASLLLQEIESTKAIGSTFRRWRYQVPAFELEQIDRYLSTLRLRNIVASRIAYEKRKSKALSQLQMNTTHIQLRNYFNKYWKHVKLRRCKEMQTEVVGNRERFSQLRKLQAQLVIGSANKNASLLVNIFLKFVLKAKTNPCFKHWRGLTCVSRKQRNYIFPLLMRNEVRKQIHALHLWKHSAQSQQNKEIQIILAENSIAINTTDSIYTKLKGQFQQLIQKLSLFVSGKVISLVSFKQRCFAQALAHRIFFRQGKDDNTRYLLKRLSKVLTFVCKRVYFTMLITHSESQRKLEIALNKENIFRQKHQRQLIKKIFCQFRARSQAHKTGFSKLKNIDSAFRTYRLCYAFAGLLRKCQGDRSLYYGQQQQHLEEVVQQQQETHSRTMKTKNELQTSLITLLSNLLRFEERSRAVRLNMHNAASKRKFLTLFRRNAKQKKLSGQIMSKMFTLLQNKLTTIFWKGILWMKHNKDKQICLGELSQANRRRKDREQEQATRRVKLQVRFEDEQLTHAAIRTYCLFYANRYQSILRWYANRNQFGQKQLAKREIFSVWKGEILAVWQLADVTGKFFKRHFLQMPYWVFLTYLQEEEDKCRGLFLCMKLFIRKANRAPTAALAIWRSHSLHQQCQEMLRNTHSAEIIQNSLHDQCQESTKLLSGQAKMASTSFIVRRMYMALKTMWRKCKQTHNKLAPFGQRANKRCLVDAMQRWKYMLYHWSTARAYLAYKAAKYKAALKRDVFLSLKMHRAEVYRIVSCADLIYTHLKEQLLRSLIFKLKNIADYNTCQLHLRRKQVLLTLITRKDINIRLMLQRSFSSWRILIIDRINYLPLVLKQSELAVIKRAFTKINQSKYWHRYYAQDALTSIDSEIVNQTKTATMTLIRDGFNPEELQTYLRRRQADDAQQMKKVINHLRTWAGNKPLIKAFHSWKEFVGLKKSIKSALLKIFQSSSGLDWCWAKWKAKDTAFEQVLWKESRKQMLQRYRDLSGLLKEYRRDIKEGYQGLQEIARTNDTYREQAQRGFEKAFRNLTSNLMKGLRQALTIWRSGRKVHQFADREGKNNQLIHSLSQLADKRDQVKYRMAMVRQENRQLKEKCLLGMQCGQLLQDLLEKRDILSVDLADKEHNLKLLLEDNLKLKHKMRTAQQNAQLLLRKVGDDNPMR